MAIATGGERSVRFEGGVWFWQEGKAIYFTIADPQLDGHSAIGTVATGSDAWHEIHKVLVAMGRKVD